MAAAAGVAVAITVVALAAGDYAGTRSTLRGQIDQALTSRAPARDAAAARAAAAGRWAGPGGGTGFPAAQLRRRATRSATPRARCSTSPRRARSSGATRPTRAGCPSTRAPVRRRAAARHATSATCPCKGVHLRVLTVGLGDAGAMQVARPLTEVDDALQQLCSCSSRSCRGRHPARRRARRGRRARGARAGRALHAPDRGADRQSRPLAAARGEGGTS